MTEREPTLVRDVRDSADRPDKTAGQPCPRSRIPGIADIADKSTDGEECQPGWHDLVGVLRPVVVAVLEPEPGWVWARCATCAEVRYQHRVTDPGRCIMTPGCKGKMSVYLEVLCSVCGRLVTARRRGLDTRFCSKKCEGAR